MERGGNLNPKPPTQRDRKASFSSCPKPHHQPNKCEPHHHAIEPAGGCRALDHNSTSELSIFNAHRYFNNEVTINNNNNNRVSPLLSQHKHNPEAERDDDIKETKRSHSYSASSSSGGYANIKNHKAHSFHAAAQTPCSSSSSSYKASWNSQVGLLSHPTTNAIAVSTRNPPPHIQTFIDLSKKIKASLSKPIWLLRRKCPCSDKNSVQVNENTTPKPKTPPIKTTASPSPTPQSTLSHNQTARNSVNHKTTPKDDHKLTTTTDHKEAVNLSPRFQFQPANALNHQFRRPLSEGFAFPLFLAAAPPATTTTTTTASPTKPQVVLNVVHEEEEPPRDSLQVFQPPSSPPKSRVMDEDAASDASSDLFEIESFSTQPTTVAYPMRPTFTECHEQAEATTVHDFFFAGDNTSSTVWWRRHRDTEVPPPLPTF